MPIQTRGWVEVVPPALVLLKGTKEEVEGRWVEEETH